MKRILSVLLLVTLMVSALLPAMAFATPAPDIRYVKTGNGKPLNVRAQPSTSSAKVTELPYRTEVVVHETYGDWCLIEPMIVPQDQAEVWSQSYWVMKSFLVTQDPGPWSGKSTPVPPSYDEVDAAVSRLRYLMQPYYAEICTSRPSNYVHLRWIPHTGARYIDKYLAGEELMVLAESKDWAQVQVIRTGYVGFILKSCVNPVPVYGGASGGAEAVY